MSVVVRPRVAPGERTDLGLVNAAICKVLGLAAGTTGPNLFLTFGQHRRLFRGWLAFAGALMPAGRLPRRETELVILRIAHRRGCGYELEHHRRLGAKAGISASELAALGDEASAATWSPREAALLVAVDQLLDDRDVSDPTWTELAAHLDERQLIEVVLLVGHYDMLATTIGTLRIETDRPRRG